MHADGGQRSGLARGHIELLHCTTCQKTGCSSPCNTTDFVHNLKTR